MQTTKVTHEGEDYITVEHKGEELEVTGAGARVIKYLCAGADQMDMKELLKNNWGIAIDCLKLAKHGAPDIGRLNDTLIEMRKRLTAMGVDMDTLES